MATRIEREFAFQAGVYFEGEFLMTIYELSLSMEVDTDSIKEQNIAMDRIHYFLHECLGNSIFVQDAEKKVIEKYLHADIKVCTLPEEPYDQIMGLILMLKLNAIVEERLVITDCEFGSKMSTGIKFDMNIEQAIDLFPGKHWWNDSRLITSDRVADKKDKVVKLFNAEKWADLELTWKEKIAQKN